MICPHCGFDNKDGTKFCGKCGKDLPDISDLFNVSDNPSEVSKQLQQNNNSNSNSTFFIETPKSDSFSNTLDNTSLSFGSNTSENRSFIDKSTNAGKPSYANPSSSSANIAFASAKNLVSAPEESFSQPQKPYFDSVNSGISAETSSNTNYTSETIPLNTTKKTKINLKREVPKKKSKIRVGYSNVINTPEFIKKHREYNLKILLMGLAFICSPSVFIFIYGKISGDITTNEAIKFGLIFSGLFALILSLFYLGRVLGKPWEGVIISKGVETRRRKRGKYSYEDYEVYVITISTDSGDTKYIEERDHSGYYYQHFNVQERIKYHPSIGYYEKYDKTHEKVLLCPFCSNLVSIDKDKCRCGAPLIK